jgi:hypothetical protein
MEKQTRVWECLVEGSRTRFFDLPFFGKSSEWFREILVPTLGNLENAENWASQLWEGQKRRKRNGPKVGKHRKQEKQSFPILGSMENAENRPSQSRDAYFSRILPKFAVVINHQE